MKIEHVLTKKFESAFDMSKARIKESTYVNKIAKTDYISGLLC